VNFFFYKDRLFTLFLFLTRYPLFLNSLEKDGEKRPTPKQMLDHPFIQLSSQKHVNLELWIKQVWEWDD